MDPVACIVDRIAFHYGTPQRDGIADLRLWLAMGGFKPTAEQVQEYYARQNAGEPMPVGMINRLRKNGLIV